MPPTKQRWRAQGWPSYTAAYRAFREVIERALERGLQPGQNIGREYEDFLLWLIRGHPRVETLLNSGLKHFSICENGRPGAVGPACYSFAVVDLYGRIKPFSTCDALTGQLHGQHIFYKDNPFRGMTS